MTQFRGHFDAPWGLLGTLSTNLLTKIRFNLSFAGSVFHSFLGNVRFVYFDATLERNRYYCRSRHPSRSHLRPKVTPNPSRAAKPAQPSSDFGGAAEPSPAEPISAGPAQPTQLSKVGICPSGPEPSGEPTYRCI